MRRTYPNKHNIIDLTDNANNLEMPQKAPNLPPTLTYKSRANTPSIPTTKITTLPNFGQIAHHSLFQAPGCMDPSEFTTLQKTCKDLHDSIFAFIFNLPFQHPSATKLQPSFESKHQQCQEGSKEPPTVTHPSHPDLESEIASFTHRIASFSYLPTLTEFSEYQQHHYDLDDLVKAHIRQEDRR